MSVAIRQPAHRLRGERRREAIAGYLFLLPNLLGFLVFVLGPVVAAFILGFVKWDMLTSPEFVGLQNYKDVIFGSGQVVQPIWYYVYNTLFLMLGIVPGQNTAVDCRMQGLHPAVQYLWESSHIRDT